MQVLAPRLSLADIQATSALISPFILRMPVHIWRGREIAALLGSETEIILKLELFQHSGSFKARGALANVLRLSDEAGRSAHRLSQLATQRVRLLLPA